MQSSAITQGDDFLAEQYNNLRKDLLIEGGEYVESTDGGNNDFTIVVDVNKDGTDDLEPITSIVAGHKLKVKFSANIIDVGANIPTLAVEDDGSNVIQVATEIKDQEGNTLISNDIKNGEIIELVYDGTYFRLARLTSLSFSKFGGNGADGVLDISSGTTDIDCGGLDYLEKNYSSISITGTGALTFSNPGDNGTVIILKSQGDVILTSSTVPCVDVRGMGGAGGAKGNALADGSPGKNGVGVVADSNYFGSGGIGTGAMTGGPAGFIYTLKEFFTDSARKLETRNIRVVAGSGGGGGGGGFGNGVNTAGGDGARGGGAFMIECKGALDFSGNIDCSGSGGSVGVDSTGGVSAHAGGGGGGGGGAGMSLILYNTLTANTGTVTAGGGAGGGGGGGATSPSGGNAYGGGGGGGGGAKGGAPGIGGAGRSAGNGYAGGNGATGAGGGGGGGAGATNATARTGGAGGTAGGNDSLCGVELKNTVLT